MQRPRRILLLAKSFYAPRDPGCAEKNSYRGKGRADAKIFPESDRHPSARLLDHD
jgi:hypothetical protein